MKENEPLITGFNPQAFLVARMVRFEENRHHVGAEQENSHFGRVGS
jgi:hypothetical protein